MTPEEEQTQITTLCENIGYNTAIDDILTLLDTIYSKNHTV